MAPLLSPREPLAIHKGLQSWNTLVELQFLKQELLPKGMPSQQNKRELSSKEIDQQLKHFLQATENKFVKVKIKGGENISMIFVCLVRQMKEVIKITSDTQLAGLTEHGWEHK